MSTKLDQELADAIGTKADEAPSSTPGVVRSAQPLRSAEPASRSPRNLALLVTLLVMVGAVVALFLVGFKEAAVYATAVDTLAKSKSEYVGRKVRVEGELVPGTLVKRDQPCEYRFTVHGKDSEAKLPIRYAQCVIPDTFRDVPGGGVQVTSFNAPAYALTGSTFAITWATLGGESAELIVDGADDDLADEPDLPPHPGEAPTDTTPVEARVHAARLARWEEQATAIVIVAGPNDMGTGTGFFISLLYLPRKCSARRPMSSRRSRSAGKRIG